MKSTGCIVLLLSMAFFAGTTPSIAQEPVPKPPYVAPVPLNAHWTVTLNFPDIKVPAGGKAPVPHLPATIDTVKTGDTKRVTISFRDGTSQRFDQVGIYMLTDSSSGASLFIPTSDSPPYPFYTEGYLFVESLAPSTFKNVVKYEDVDCFHFQSGTLDIWIAVDSMLPVAAKQGGVTASFQFLPPPGEPIPLPADEAALLQKQIKAYNNFRAMR